MKSLMIVRYERLGQSLSAETLLTGLVRDRQTGDRQTGRHFGFNSQFTKFARRSPE